MSHLSAAPVPKTWKAISMVCMLAITISMLHLAITYASIAKAPSPEQMFANSNLVVTGKVLDINYRWRQGDESSIITTLRLQVEGVAKGELNAGIIEVNYPGGQMGELGLWVEDQPTFTVGEDVLLYLKSVSTPLNGAPRYTLTGGTFFAKSYSVGNTTIGADGEQVPIVIVATALWGITETDNNEKTPSTEIISHGPWELVKLDIPTVIYAQGENVQVEAKVTLSPPSIQ